MSPNLKSGLLAAFCTLLFQSVVGSQLLQVMAPFRHIKTQLRKLRYSSGFVPAGRMRAMCGTDGRWNPDPAAFVCTCEILIFIG